MIAATIYRLGGVIYCLFVVHSMHKLIFGHSDYSFETFNQLSTFLTFLVLLLQTLYLLLATPIQLAKLPTLHGTVLCVTLTACLVVFLLFWSIFLYDPSLLIPETTTIVPAWFNHASHSAGICLTAFDGLLWKPASALLGPSATTLIALTHGYNLSLEYLAHVKHFYPYPLLSNVSHKGRYLIYGAAWILVLTCFIVAVYYCKYLVSLSDARRTKSRGFVSDQSLRNTTEENPRKTRKAD